MSLSDLIYIKEKSLPIPLTNKIIEVYEKIITGNVIIPDDGQTLNLKTVLSILIHTEMNEEYRELHAFLLNLKKLLNDELYKHIIEYLLEISNKYKDIENNSSINLEHLQDLDMCIANRKPDLELNINNKTKKIDRINYKTDFYETKDIEVILCKFIWFLNDYSGEIRICNTTFLSPKKGTLLIYPISWMYNVVEEFDKKDIYVLEGYIPKKIKQLIHMNDANPNPNPTI